MSTWWSWTTAISLLVGFGSGILAALLGVGGAVVTTPVIRFMGATPIESVGSTVPAILPGAISGSLRYHREGYIRYRIAAVIGACGIGFSALGAWVSGQVDARLLMVATAFLVIWSGSSMVRRGRRVSAGLRAIAASESASGSGGGTAATLHRPADEPPTLEGDEPPSADDRVPDPPLPVMVGLGVVAGFLAGLLGIGGGIVLTPGLTIGAKLPVKHAVATSLAAVSFMSISALATHIALGHVAWRFALPLAIGIIPGARVGARITVDASEAAMYMICGSLLGVFGVIYLGRELFDLFF